MNDLATLRKIWNSRHYRVRNGWKAPGISAIIKAATASRLIAEGTVYENTKGNNPFLDLTDTGRALIKVKSA